MSKRPNVETFGEATRGLPTGNSLIEFADGSAINLTQSIGVDSNGNPHETAIPPGVPTPSRTLDAALDWILSQQSCRR